MIPGASNSSNLRINHWCLSRERGGKEPLKDLQVVRRRRKVRPGRVEKCFTSETFSVICGVK